MAKSKIEEFTQEEIYLADLAKSLSHPARIKILKILSEMNSCVCGEIVDLLPLAQATVSQHLKELKRIGLVEGEIEGPKTCYCLNKKAIEKAFSSFHKLFANINRECKTSCGTVKK
jgi:DNA-binding transcriptional ArsR family regulator